MESSDERRAVIPTSCGRWAPRMRRAFAIRSWSSSTATRTTFSTVHSDGRHDFLHVDPDAQTLVKELLSSESLA